MPLLSNVKSLGLNSWRSRPIAFLCLPRLHVPFAVLRRRRRRRQRGGTCPPPPKKKLGKILFEAIITLNSNISGQYHAKFGDFVNFSDKCHKNSSILIFFFWQISCTIRAFCKFFIHIFSGKNVFSSQSWLSSLRLSYCAIILNDYL